MCMGVISLGNKARPHGIGYIFHKIKKPRAFCPRFASIRHSTLFDKTILNRLGVLKADQPDLVRLQQLVLADEG